MYSRAEGLEKEPALMEALSRELSGISKADGAPGLERARRIIARLRDMNNRWNIPELGAFLKERQKALFF